MERGRRLGEPANRFQSKHATNTERNSREGHRWCRGVKGACIMRTPPYKRRGEGKKKTPHRKEGEKKKKKTFKYHLEKKNKREGKLWRSEVPGRWKEKENAKKKMKQVNPPAP